MVIVVTSRGLSFKRKDRHVHRHIGLTAQFNSDVRLKKRESKVNRKIKEYLVNFVENRDRFIYFKQHTMKSLILAQDER